MSKMNEGRILEALNESRKSKNRYRRLRENYIGEDEELLDTDVDELEDDVEDVEDDAEDVEDDVLDIEDVPEDEDTPEDDVTSDVDPLAHVDDAHVGTDTDNDPDYPVMNVHQTTVDDLLDDVETAINDMDDIEDDLFDVDYDDEEDDWDDDEETWDDEDDLVDDVDDLEDDVDDVEDDIDEIELDVDDLEGDEDDILDIEIPEDEDEELGEAVYSFSGGKKHKLGTQEIRRRKKRRHGYVTMANGKRRKMTSKEKAARKKNAKKMNRGTAKKKAIKRAKRARKANENLYTNEQAFMTLMNGVLADSARKSNGRINRTKVTEVKNGYVDGNSIVLEAVVRNAQGETDTAKFVIKGRPNGRYLVTESSDFFEGSNLKIGGKYRMNGNRFVFESMSYELKTRRGTINESFAVVCD